MEILIKEAKNRLKKLPIPKSSAIVVILIFALFGFFQTHLSQKSQPKTAPEANNTATTPSKDVLEISDGYTAPTPSVNGAEETLVVRVVDGDTIEIENGKRVRLIGIDAPETVHPNQPVACFGREASEHVKQLLQGKIVLLAKDISETDRYGRLLRYVWLDELFVNEYLIKEGFATAVTYPPDIKYQTLFTKAESYARQNNRGLWAACNSPSSNINTLGSSDKELPSSVKSLPPKNVWGCPASHPIKGNAKSMIYHLPTGSFYNRTKPEECFASISDAETAGYRKSIR
jgi:micrococcal nuclease